MNTLVEKYRSDPANNRMFVMEAIRAYAAGEATMEQTLDAIFAESASVTGVVCHIDDVYDDFTAADFAELEELARDQ